ncbi:MAG TPA: carbohydrate binding domain-containing protein [Planctomycetota bacterium]|nr:carbohydrate binding domain-containing protein [Planctomycetota bacterium]
MTQPSGEPPRDERKTTDGLFLGGEMEISPPPDVPLLAKPVARPMTRAATPSRQLLVARGSSTRPTICFDAPERHGLDDTTKIVACIALGLVALGIIALLMLGKRAPVGIPEPTPVAAPANPPPAPVAPERLLPANTVTRPQPPPRSGLTNPANLVKNPSFEQLADGKPVDWQPQNYNGEPVFSVTANGHRGKNAVCISSSTGADSKWFQYFTVKPNTTYLMKGWAKCENITGPGRGVQFNMEPNDFRSDEIKGTSDWKMLQFTFESRDKTEVYINCLFSGWGQSTGTAWFDDIEVIEVFSSK